MFEAYILKPFNFFEFGIAIIFLFRLRVGRRPPVAIFVTHYGTYGKPAGQQTPSCFSILLIPSQRLFAIPKYNSSIIVSNLGLP